MSTNAQQLQIPKPSPTQTIKQEFAIGTIELSFSRPGLKGRNIGTDFVPYDVLWRTGANGSTIITFSDDVTFGGNRVSKGSYGLLTIPNEKEWIVILTSDLNVHFPNQYIKENEIARFTAPVKKTNIPTETFSMNFSSFTINSCLLQISWDSSLLEVPISTDIDMRISKQIETILDGDNRPYYEAAQYYFDTDKDLKKTTEWIEKATANPKNTNMLHMFWLKAQIYQRAGEKSKAKNTAEILIEKATKMGNQDYVAKSKNLIKSL